MLTYPLNKESGRSLYEQLYEGIRRDILSGTLPAHQRLPSKRALAQHLEVSIITVQNDVGASITGIDNTDSTSILRCKKSAKNHPTAVHSATFSGEAFINLNFNITCISSYL